MVRGDDDLLFVVLALLVSLIFRITMRVIFPSQMHLYFEKGYSTRAIMWLGIACLLLNFGLIVSLSFRTSDALCGVTILIEFGFIFAITLWEFFKEYREMLHMPMIDEEEVKK